MSVLTLYLTIAKKYNALRKCATLEVLNEYLTQNGDQRRCWHILSSQEVESAGQQVGLEFFADILTFNQQHCYHMLRGCLSVDITVLKPEYVVCGGLCAFTPQTAAGATTDQAMLKGQSLT